MFRALLKFLVWLWVHSIALLNQQIPTVALLDQIKIYMHWSRRTVGLSPNNMTMTFMWGFQLLVSSTTCALWPCTILQWTLSHFFNLLTQSLQTIAAAHLWHSVLEAALHWRPPQIWWCLSPPLSLCPAHPSRTPSHCWNGLQTDPAPNQTAKGIQSPRASQWGEWIASLVKKNR